MSFFRFLIVGMFLLQASHMSALLQDHVMVSQAVKDSLCLLMQHMQHQRISCSKSFDRFCEKMKKDEQAMTYSEVSSGMKEAQNLLERNKLSMDAVVYASTKKILDDYNQFLIAQDSDQEDSR